MIVKFVFWKLLETFEIVLEASNSHIARTPNGLRKLIFRMQHECLEQIRINLCDVSLHILTKLKLILEISNY